MAAFSTRWGTRGLVVHRVPRSGRYHSLGAPGRVHTVFTQHVLRRIGWETPACPDQLCR